MTKVRNGFLAILLLVGGFVALNMWTERTTAPQALPRPKVLQDKEDGRKHVVVRIYWEPRAAAIEAAWTIGGTSGNATQIGVAKLKPFTRSGFARPGEIVQVGWSFSGAMRVINVQFWVSGVLQLDEYTTKQINNVAHAVR